MDRKALRRIVTDHDEHGRSRILIDGAAAKSIAVEEAAAAFAFRAVGASHARVDTARYAMRRKTDTLDVIIRVRGEVGLLLDGGGATALKLGDVVIQRATNRA